MKKAVLTGLRSLRVVEAPEPVMTGDTDVLLDVGTVGVCGSDVHYYTTGRIGSQVVQYPFAVGHEFSGVVKHVGKAVRRVKPGDRVAVDPAMWCGECDQCRQGRRHTCRVLKFLGCPGQSEGCLCERMVMPERCCYPVGKGVTLEQAALVEPMSIGAYSVTLAGSVRGCEVGILGCGPIGLSVLFAARAGGVKTVYGTDRIDRRVAFAKSMGMDWVGNPDRADVVKEIRRQAPGLLDVVFECCGQQAAMDQAVAVLKPGGVLVLTGIPEVDRVSFEIETLRRSEITIRNVRRQNECVQPALDLIAGGRAPMASLVTHRFPLEKVQEAFNLVADYRDGVIKAMVQVGGESG